jgi:diguanylate cyclase (GGDEF)-like protein
MTRASPLDFFCWAGFLLCAGPALVFFAARSNRRSLSAVSVLGNLSAVVLIAIWAPSGFKLDAVSWGIWSALAAIWAWFESDDDRQRDQDLNISFEGLVQQSVKVSQALTRIKIDNIEIEREQKRTLALYGAVKSLAQALSWEDTKPILESAVDQYLGALGYSFYVGSTRENSTFKSLICRGLHASPGASYAALHRCLEERSLSPFQPHLLKAPEESVVVPIEYQGDILGLFYGKVPHGVREDDFFAKAKIFIGEISFAFRRLRLFQDVDNLSRIDGLTGTHRRGEFEERLRYEVIRARTFKTTLGVLMLDIDQFKLLNDRYGHPFGDQVLRRTGEILNASVYETDFVARYGGEEFVVILPRAEPAGALRKAELIRRSIESEKFLIAFESVSATVSIGMAHFPRDASDPSDLVAQADRALYEAKVRGRNQVLDIEQVKRGQ